MADFLRNMVAENGETCSWKFKLEDWMVCRMLSKDVLATVVGFTTSEVLCWLIFQSDKFKHVLPL